MYVCWRVGQAGSTRLGCLYEVFQNPLTSRSLFQRAQSIIKARMFPRVCSTTVAAS